MIKKTIVFFVMILSFAILSACGEAEEQTQQTEDTQVTSDTPTIPVSTIPIPQETEPAVTELEEGYMYSYLTGLPVKEEIGKLRPVGFQIDNEKKAMPQVAISRADVIYEVPIEAYEVRLTAFFQDMTGLDRIGPLRSARSYHPGFAAEYDAIFFHNGHSDLALSRLNDDRCDDIEAVDRDYNAKFTSNDHLKGHNDFTSQKKVEDRIALRKFRREISSDFSYKWKFMPQGETNNLENGQSAMVVHTNYKQNKSYFCYSEKDGLYYRYAYNTEHIDGDYGDQIAVKNIIIQYCGYNLEWDKNTKDIHTVGTGKGAFVTNGKYVNITWEKENYWDNTHYYYEDGTEIKLNPGKSWVCIILPSMTGEATFE